MNAFRQKCYLTPKGLLMGIALGIASAGAVSAGTIAQVPLFIAASLDPNIMFILDDSGSMNSSFLPDGICNIGDSKRAKSSTVNSVAYNPSITYLPPVDANGVSLGDSPFTAAWFNGYTLPHPTSTTTSSTGSRVNLSTQFRPTWSDNTTGCSDDDVYKGTAQAAYYYQFSPPQTGCSGLGTITDEDCYVKKTIGATGTEAEKAAEKQNFANWYSYYRTRLMMAKAGISRTFAQLSTSPRVGYGRINSGSNNIDGVNLNTIEKGVRTFSGTDRTNFFNWLFQRTGGSSTPLRRALDSAGKYYTNEATNGPWSTTPGTSGGSLLACRPSYTILMTDGYWNGDEAGTPAARTNNDGTDGLEIVAPDGAKLAYKADPPFKDGFSNTLADVAMYYWKRDLCPAIENKVPTSPTDPAFWQHMVTYGIALGIPTSINPNTALEAISTKATINWPNPATNTGTSRIDDLLHASINGRGRFFNASDSNEFASSQNSALSKIISDSANSASSVAANSTRLEIGTQVFQAVFDPRTWSGDLKAFDVQTGGALTDSWKAANNLPAEADRKIFTFNPLAASGSRGVVFQWGNLTCPGPASGTCVNIQSGGKSQQESLNKLAGVTDGNGVLRANWLRGVQTNEKLSETDTAIGHIFRKRTSLLGDIINSDPLYVGIEDYGYSALAGAAGSSYTDFRNSTAYQGRRRMLYVGANDGMLHGFNANTGSSLTEGGKEIFAYIPNALYPELSKLTSPTYIHQYYVDGSFGKGDVFDGTNWHTLLAGAAGAGGRALFGLDITNPDAFSSANVLWEFSNTNDADLGYTMANPSVARTEDGHWAVIVGNGYNSDNGHAVLFVLDALTGTVLQKIDTLIGTTANKNGLSTPIAVDTNNDLSVDAVYAGDLYGNLWKFDLSGSVGSWTVSGGAPLFVACTISGTSCPADKRQPITAKPNVGVVGADQDSQGIMVYFGTGKYFETGDNSVGTSPQIQTFYGLWDQGTAITDRVLLQEQTINFQGKFKLACGQGDACPLSDKELRVVSKNPVCYKASTIGCTTSSPLKKGWALNLLKPPVSPATVGTAQGERIVSFPLMRRGLVVFPTVIPTPLACASGGNSFLMEVDALSGGAFSAAAFDTSGGGGVNSEDFVIINDVSYAASGVDMGVGITKTPTVVDSVEVDYKYSSGSTGQVGTVVDMGGGSSPPPEPPPTPSPNGVRRAWQQLK